MSSRAMISTCVLPTDHTIKYCSEAITGNVTMISSGRALHHHFADAGRAISTNDDGNSQEEPSGGLSVVTRGLPQEP